MHTVRMLIVALAIICSTYCQGQSQNQGQGITVVNSSETVIYNGSANIRVDDELVEFKIGGTVIPIIQKVDYRYVHSFPLLKIKSTDIISIKGRNYAGVYEATNPAAILASISYYDGENKVTILTSNLTWKCEGDTPMNVTPNDGTLYYPVATEISGTAQNIWAFNYSREVTCVYDPNNLPAVDSSSFVGNAYLNIDNELIEFKIGGKSINFKNVGGDHTYVHYFPQIKIKSTDVISITAKNWENWNWDWNPGSIMATLKYTNNLGQVISTNTSDKWICNGLGAMTMLNNVKNKWWVPITGIDINAQHIWNVNLSPVCTCTYDPQKKVNAYATLRVDDELLEFWVNGEKKDFYPLGNNWTAVYKISFYYETGQQITIVGKNQWGGFSENNPASIVATIDYTDKDGSSKRINTSLSWKCNGKTPMNLGKNTQNRWWFEVIGVDREALNIWAADSAQISSCSLY